MKRKQCHNGLITQYIVNTTYNNLVKKVVHPWSWNWDFDNFKWDFWNDSHAIPLQRGMVFTENNQTIGW